MWSAQNEKPNQLTFFKTIDSFLIILWKSSVWINQNQKYYDFGNFPETHKLSYEQNQIATQHLYEPWSSQLHHAHVYLQFLVLWAVARG
jgi:hypothetical protein